VERVNGSPGGSNAVDACTPRSAGFADEAVFEPVGYAADIA
jgi:hypothetical protein